MQQESPYDIKDFIFIDVETTGANIHDSSNYLDKHIIKKDLTQIGLAWMEGERIQSAYTYVKPPEIYFQHTDKWWKVGGKPNTDPKLVEKAPSWNELHPWIMTQIGNRIPVGHNANFDAQVLNDTSFHYGLRFLDRGLWKCTFEDSKSLLRSSLDSYSLKNVCKFFDINMGNHHDARDDAIACLKVFESLQMFRARPDWIFV